MQNPVMEVPCTQAPMDVDETLGAFTPIGTVAALMTPTEDSVVESAAVIDLPEVIQAKLAESLATVSSDTEISDGDFVKEDGQVLEHMTESAIVLQPYFKIQHESEARVNNRRKMSKSKWPSATPKVRRFQSLTAAMEEL